MTDRYKCVTDEGGNKKIKQHEREGGNTLTTSKTVRCDGSVCARTRVLVLLIYFCMLVHVRIRISYSLNENFEEPCKISPVSCYKC